jgi:hypothetical protein
MISNQNFLKINFAGDIKLTNNIYNYFLSNSIVNEKIKVEEDTIIILIDKEENNKNTVAYIRSLLQKFLNSFIGYETYKIFEFANVITVGIPKDIVEISNFVFCEICGYGLSNEEELLVHRRSHGII